MCTSWWWWSFSFQWLFWLMIRERKKGSWILSRWHLPRKFRVKVSCYEVYWPFYVRKFKKMSRTSYRAIHPGGVMVLYHGLLLSGHLGCHENNTPEVHLWPQFRPWAYAVNWQFDFVAAASFYPLKMLNLIPKENPNSYCVNFLGG